VRGTVEQAHFERVLQTIYSCVCKPLRISGSPAAPREVKDRPVFGEVIGVSLLAGPTAALTTRLGPIDIAGNASAGAPFAMPTPNGRDPRASSRRPGRGAALPPRGDDVAHAVRKRPECGLVETQGSAA